MELIDRYVHAVRFWLPKPMRDDVAAELAEELRSQVEAREAELHRPLEPAELSALLDRWGAPLAVAQRYLPQRHLIGPALFPLYRLALKIVALVYLLPWLLVWAGLTIFDASYRSAGLRPLVGWWLIALHLAVAITILFTVLERSATARRHVTASPADRWPPANPDAIPRSQSIGEALGAALVLLWWIGTFALPPIPEVVFVLTPIWTVLFWPMAIFYAAVAALWTVNVVRPWWSRSRVIARLALNGVGVTLVTILLIAGRLIDVQVPAGAAAKIARVESVINSSIVVTLGIIGLALLIRSGQDLRRLSGRPPFGHWLVRVLSAE